jgi:hypothetical protein
VRVTQASASQPHSTALLRAVGQAYRMPKSDTIGDRCFVRTGIRFGAVACPPGVAACGGQMWVGVRRCRSPIPEAESGQTAPARLAGGRRRAPSEPQYRTCYRSRVGSFGPVLMSVPAWAEAVSFSITAVLGVADGSGEDAGSGARGVMR